MPSTSGNLSAYSNGLNTKLGRSRNLEPSSKYIWIVFLVSPFISYLLTFKNLRTSWAKNLVWAFTVFYGFTFVISGDMADADITRYIVFFHNMYDSSININQFFRLLYNPETGNADIAIPLINFILTRFTRDETILIGAFALMFGFFYSRNLSYVFERLRGNLKNYTVLLIIIFVLIVPIWTINGIRFYSACHVFLFGLLPYLFEKRKNLLWVSFSSILFHFSFATPVLILLVYLLAGNRPTIYFVFFLFSFFLSELNIQQLNNLMESYLPEVFYSRAGTYISESRISALASTGENAKNWYAVVYKKALIWSIVGILIVLYFQGKKVITQNISWVNLYSFTLLIFGFSNIVSLIPSGERFLILSCLFAMPLIILYVQEINISNALRMTLNLALLPLLLFIIVSIRDGFSTFGLITLIGNPFVIFFFENDLALIDLLK